MTTIMKNMAFALLVLLMLIVDIPILPVELVVDAEAVYGVRRRTHRRTAVVAYSAGAANAAAASQAAASSQQQAAPPDQQSQAPQPVSAVPIGTVVTTLPGKCIAVTVANVNYQDCEGTFYRTAFQGNNLVYVSVEKPL
ncbi:MAG: hypothetical protein ACR2PB_05285 [Desulfocapsaceae bacterium]